MKADRILTEGAQAVERARFMKGVAWACQFLRDVDALNEGGTEHAEAMYRDGKLQAQVLPKLLAAMTADPDLIPGANAILTEYVCLGGEHGAGVMHVDAYESKTFEDFKREAYPEQCSNVVPFSRESRRG